MGRTVLTYNDVADINQYLKESGAAYQVHMHDICGSQSFSLRPDEESVTGDPKTVKEIIIRYFIGKGMTLKFSESGTDFVVL